MNNGLRINVRARLMFYVIRDVPSLLSILMFGLAPRLFPPSLSFTLALPPDLYMAACCVAS